MYAVFIVYRMFMPKNGISVTLDERNLLWLKARTLATRTRSVSETLDQLVTAARTARTVPDTAIRSVVGTVDIAATDPDLAQADAYVTALMEQALIVPASGRDTPARKPGHRSREPKRVRRG